MFETLFSPYFTEFISVMPSTAVDFIAIVEVHMVVSMDSTYCFHGNVNDIQAVDDFTNFGDINR